MLSALQAWSADCVPPPAGLVAWWPGAGNANDIAGTNNGVLEGGVVFVAGKVGQAFSLNGTNAHVRVPASTRLNLGLAVGFTIETWINPADVSRWRPIAEWNSGSFGVNFGLGGFGAGSLHINVKSTRLIEHNLTSAAGLLTTNALQHVAATYDKTSGNATLYLNGAVVAQQNLGIFTPMTTGDLYFGFRPYDGGSGTRFVGLIDEVSLYDLVLPPGEITAIYNAGSAGKCTVPFITSQPQSQSVVVGSSATFVVGAGGTPPLSYQWQFNSADIAGATASSLVLTNVQPDQAGNYLVIVSSASGTVTSSSAVLTVNPPPTCASAPAGLVAWWPGQGNAHDSALTNKGTLQNGASYAPGLVGQAFTFDGIDDTIEVPSSSALSFAPNAAITVELWAYRTTTSDVAHLLGKRVGCTETINYEMAWDSTHGLQFNGGTGVGALTGIQLPLHTWTHLAGTFEAGTYKFYINGELVATATGLTLGPTSSAPLKIGGAGDCQPFGGLLDEVSIYSRALTSDEIAAIYAAGSAGKCGLPPSILSSPQSQSVVVGSSATFVVGAGGTPPLSYQWQFNSADIAGATASSLELTNVQPDQAGNYRVIVSSASGTVTSSSAVLTVNPLPTCATAAAGLVAWWPGQANAVDSVGINNGVVQNGVGFATGEVGLAFDLNGTDQYVDVPSSASLSPTASLSVEAWINPRLPLHSVASPIVKKAGEGSGQQNGYALEFKGTSGVIFSVYVSGGKNWVMTAPAPLPMNQWSHVAGVYNGTSVSIYVNGALVGTPVAGPGQIVPSGNNLQIGRDPSNPSRYFNGLIDEPSVYNTALSAAEVAAIYAVGSAGKCGLPPSVLSPPQNQAVVVGSSATFVVGAGGTPPLSYQWRFAGTDIPGGTDAGYSLTSAQPGDAGNYSVVITSPYGSVTSAVATLTVLIPATILSQPESQAVLVGDSATFSVTAAGTEPFSYQWRRDETNLLSVGNVSGALTAGLTLTNVSLNDAGSYSVVVSNPYGSVTSAVAVLIVSEVPISRVFVASTNAMSGGAIVVPVNLAALGSENALGFSVTYDVAALTFQSAQLGAAAAGASLLINPGLTSSGRLGIAVSQPSGVTFPAGTQEVVRISFLIQPVTNTISADIGFADVPTARQLVDSFASILPATYAAGIVALTPAKYEADVSPRPDGDHVVTIADWVQVGRFVAGLDAVAAGDELLRADCAPRSSLGNGKMSVTDWVQAGRYAVGIDPLTVAGGPGAAKVHTDFPLGAKQSGADGLDAIRTLEVSSLSGQVGQSIGLPILLHSLGDESALGFSVSFDPAILSFSNATAGTGAAGASFNLNATASDQGKVGVVLAQPPGSLFAAGTQQVAVLQFVIKTTAADPVVIAFSDTPVVREVSDASANVLSTSYIDGQVGVNPLLLLEIGRQGANVVISWPAAPRAFLLQSADMLPAASWDVVPVDIVTNGSMATVTLSPTNAHRFFRLVGN